MIELSAESHLLDRFKVVGALGPNRLGNLLVAKDIQRGRPVTLTVLAQPFPSEGQLQLLKERISALARLRHRNLVRFREFIGDSGVTGYASEYFSAVDLGAYLRSESPEVMQRINILLQAAAGLDALHGAGELHGCLNHKTTLVNRAGEVKLSDFGLQDLPQNTGNSDVNERELACFRAPQQRAGRASVFGDIYALGMLGRFLFCGNAWAEKKVRLGNEQLNAGIPRIWRRSLQKILERATSPREERRYTSVRDFASDLKRAAAGINSNIVVGPWSFVAAMGVYLLIVLACLYRFGTPFFFH